MAKDKHDGLLCFLLAVIVVLILVIGAGAYYFLVIDNEEKIAENETQNIIEKENEKDANVNSNTNVLDTNKETENKVDKIAKELFEKGSAKIRETQYASYDAYESARPLTEKTIYGITYQKKNVLYSDVEKEYSEFFTGDILKNVLGRRFAEIDGYLYVSYGGATGWDVTNINLSRISETNNEIEYNVTYKDVEGDLAALEESCKMKIKLVNGDYRISATDYLNIDKPKYYEITERLENEDVLLVSESIKNNDGTYTLKGEIITVDTSKEQIAEYPPYKKTEVYKQITVPFNTKCEYSLDSYEYETDTVENVFSKKLYFAGGEGACFNFVFENGKCTSVVEVVTGH